MFKRTTENRGGLIRFLVTQEGGQQQIASLVAPHMTARRRDSALEQKVSLCSVKPYFPGNTSMETPDLCALPIKLNLDSGYLGEARYCWSDFLFWGNELRLVNQSMYLYRFRVFC